MNLSQFCNITLFSRPAARYTNKDRLLYSTTSTSGGRFAPTRAAGFTLIEVMVAMVILLVGIWTLAMGFPKLLGVVATQEKRSEMAQQAQRTIDQLIRHPNDLPLGTRGDTYNLPPIEVAGIDATGKPQDPSITDFNITPPNARDDMIEVIGERFTVQAPLAFPYGPYPVYVFRQGLATPASVAVYQEDFLPVGFSVNPDGSVNFPLGVDWVEINYAWVESGAGGATHHVYREVIPSSATQVAAAFAGSFGKVLSFDGIQLVQLLPAEVTVDPSGAFLLFDESAVGAMMRVNYTLLRCTLPPYAAPPDPAARRALIMSEEHRIVSSPQPITLVGSHIDETPLPLGDISGDGLLDANDETYVLAVDTITGDLCWEGRGVQPPQGLVLVDAAAGKVEVDPGKAAVGHDMRFYYVTLDQDLISVQIAPATFVDESIASPADWYRSYLAAPDLGDSAYTALLFYPCNAGHTVAVDYKYDNGSTIVTVNGEMHTINTEPDSSGYHHITLNQPSTEPIEIIAVTGKSLQAIAWWRTPNGRLERLQIGTVR